MAPREYYAHSDPDRPEQDSEFVAHSENKQGLRDPLHEHLVRVADLAGEYAAALGVVNEARTAGLLHDLGKYGDRFQARLRGEAHGVDHWSAGAWAALSDYKQDGVTVALCAHGHHVGLQHASKDFLCALDPKKLVTNHPQQLTLSEPDTEVLLARLRSSGLELPSMDRSVCPWGRKDHASAMLDVRMLFSALVDADFVDTEAHFQAAAGATRTYRE